MAIYNISNATSTMNLLELAQELNILSENVFGLMFLITVASITFLGLRFSTEADNTVIIAITMWITVIFSVMLKAMSLIGTEILVVVIVATIGSVGLLYVTSRN